MFEMSSTGRDSVLDVMAQNKVSDAGVFDPLSLPEGVLSI